MIRPTEQERADREAPCKEYYVIVLRRRAGEGCALGRASALAAIRSRLGSACRARPPANGATACGSTVCLASKSGPGVGHQPAFPPMWWLRSRHWLVSYPPAVACPWVRRRTEPGGGAEWHCRKHQRDHALALAWPGRIAPLAPSQLDLPARPAVCLQGRPGHRSVPASLERRSSGATGLRALHRRDDQHPGKSTETFVVAAGPGRPIYVEHEYVRAGALAYLAALNVHQARLLSAVSARTALPRSIAWSVRS